MVIVSQCIFHMEKTQDVKLETPGTSQSQTLSHDVLLLGHMRQWMSACSDKEQ